MAGPDGQGKVAGAKDGDRVYLQRLVGKTWKTYASVKIKSGAYSFAVRMDSHKDYQWRVYAPGTALVTGAVSKSFKVVVR